jgi:hypothetical protein
MVVSEMHRAAEISECGLYRYTLERNWGDGPTLNYLMLNPSIADAMQDDPTIARCIVRAKGLGFGGLVVTNLFAYRSTDPKLLKRVSDPVGPRNDERILEVARRAEMVICAWGKDGKLLGRAFKVKQVLSRAGIRLHALKIGVDGAPWHPLYLPYELQPIPFGLTNATPKPAAASEGVEE